MALLNLNLMRHPLNWLTVLLMVAIGSFLSQSITNFAFGPPDASQGK